MDNTSNTHMVQPSLYLAILKDDGLAWESLNNKTVLSDHHLSDTIHAFLSDDDDGDA